MTRTHRLLIAMLLLVPALAAATPPDTIVTTIDRFSLILYDFDSAEPGPMNRRILEEYVYPEIGSQTEIAIVGYSDVVGQEPHNLALATARAERIAELIRRKLGDDGYRRLEATAVGEEQAPYRFDVPEGRFLSRTVIVTLRTEGSTEWSTR